MTEIRFYHLQRTPLESALPQILEKALSAGYRIQVVVPGPEEKKLLDAGLWTYRDDSFLPHGTDDDGDPAVHPVLITDALQKRDGYNMLVLAYGCVHDPDGYDLCCEMLNGAAEDEVQAARKRWQVYKDKSYTVTYWAQDENGRWASKG